MYSKSKRSHAPRFGVLRPVVAALAAAALISACSSSSTGNGPGAGDGGTAVDCAARCQKKLTGCGVSGGADCSSICSSLTAAQLGCWESAGCASSDLRSCQQVQADSGTVETGGGSCGACTTDNSFSSNTVGGVLAVRQGGSSCTDGYTRTNDKNLPAGAACESLITKGITNDCAYTRCQTTTCCNSLKGYAANWCKPDGTCATGAEACAKAKDQESDFEFCK